MLQNDISFEQQQYAEPGKLTLYLADSKKLIAVVSLCDALRPEAESVLSTLRDQGVRLSLLTGDTATSAMSILPRDWFDDYETDCLPDQKWQWIKQQHHKDIVMVGDGLNDCLLYTSDAADE